MQAEALHEQVIYQNNALRLKVWPIQTRDSTNLRRPWHYHEQMELLYLYEGAMLVQLEQQMLRARAGDVVVIDSNQLHRTANAGEGLLSYLVLQVDLDAYYDSASMMYYSALSHPLHRLGELNEAIGEDADARDAIGRCIRDIYAEMSDMRLGYELGVSHSVKRIMLELVRCDRGRQLLSPQEADAMLRWKPVLDHIEHHLYERLDIRALSQLAYMSYHHFSKSFKQAMGMNVTHYINWKRIKRAERLLLTQHTSVREIADQVGLPNLSHFYKMFQKFNGLSPRQYRKQFLPDLQAHPDAFGEP
ncbi:AraC family transcriptional regulator [Paenibacillus sp. IB182496]|uniref:AraC family transcriptional regulator n=1 Tax=Paenibacillus sabuli TaxID=2772509 RepID=A0A927BQU0_9BACL|nr:AraC family transcriptional regulator [Paenibacillus sabuli]MBD2845051.1 AraC family transcriptional regulator [Paenibacillus sabuli]